MIKHFTIPIFDMPVTLVTKRKEIKGISKQCGDMTLLEAFEDSAGLNGTTPCGQNIICIRHNCPEVIAHEAAHLAYNIQQLTGVDFNDETNAYLIGYIVKKLNKLLGNKFIAGGKDAK
jgi:hypothetical protein